MHGRAHIFSEKIMPAEIIVIMLIAIIAFFSLVIVLKAKNKIEETSRRRKASWRKMECLRNNETKKEEQDA